MLATLSMRNAFLLLSLLAASCSAEYKTAECFEVDRDCTVWPDDSDTSGAVNPSEQDFGEVSRKVKYINSSYSLMNSSLGSLPRSPRLSTISGSFVITGNKNLVYKDELEGLQWVGGAVLIKQNPRFHLPLHLYRRLCSRAGSVCEVEVICNGKLFITDGKVTNFDRDCTIQNGDITVYGRRDLLDYINIHTVYGSVRLLHNQVESFEFLKTIRTVEYAAQKGCAVSIIANQGLRSLGLLNLKEIHLKSTSSAKTFCILKNRAADVNAYYRLESNITDMQVFSSFRTSSNYLVDTERGTFDWGNIKKIAANKRIPILLCLITGALLGLLISMYIFWALDYRFKILFYRITD